VVLYDRYLLGRTCLYHDVGVALRTLVFVEEKGLCLFHFAVALVRAVDVARYHSTEVFYVIILVDINGLIVLFPIGLNKEVRNISLSNLYPIHLRNILIFGLKHDLTFSFLKETKRGNVQSKRAFFINRRHELIELFYSLCVDFY
jgi:hypothetical protein